MLYGENIFELNGNDVVDIQNFLNHIGRSNVSRLRHLRLGRRHSRLFLLWAGSPVRMWGLSHARFHESAQRRLGRQTVQNPSCSATIGDPCVSVDVFDWWKKEV